jgi:hypothetical protein
MLHLFSDILEILGTIAFDIILTVICAIFVGCLSAWWMTRLTSAIYDGRDTDLQSIPATLFGCFIGGIIGAAVSVLSLLADSTTGNVIKYELGVSAALILFGELIIRLVKAIRAKKSGN